MAGVSRRKGEAANAIFHKLRRGGWEVVPLNPNASEVEGVRCWPDLASLPAPVDSLVIAAAPEAAPSLVRHCVEQGVRNVWFHRSFGEGSVSEEAVREAGKAGLNCIVGGCPLMYCEPVDVAHRCMRWILRWRRRVPG